VAGADRGAGLYCHHEPGHPTPGLDQKKRTLGASERNEDDRQTWRQGVDTLTADQLVFVDETGATLTLVPLYGRAPRGERCAGTRTDKRYKHLTLCASLTQSGISTGFTFLESTTNTSFLCYVTHILIPSLRPGQTVILDNLHSHKRPEVREAIEAAGCHLLLLPPYSPDFNPIELAFAKIKQYLRTAQSQTMDELEAAIGRAIDIITTQDATAFFRHCSYVPQ
jgi:transposase